MEKQSSTNNYNAPTPPLGAGTSTTSGVTVFDSSLSNNNPPPPPSYDQAIGNTTTTTTTRNVTYTTPGWSGPGVGAQNTAYHITTTTQPNTSQYTYGTSVPPSRPHHAPNYNQQPPIVIIQQQPMLPLGPEPVYITCPACNIQKLTRIEYEPSSRTHLMAALLCLVGLWCCVCLPYCAGSCMNTHHYCGNCGKFIGTYGNSL